MPAIERRVFDAKWPSVLSKSTRPSLEESWHKTLAVCGVEQAVKARLEKSSISFRCYVMTLSIMKTKAGKAMEKCCDVQSIYRLQAVCRSRDTSLRG